MNSTLTPTQGYAVKRFPGITRRIVQTLSLRNSPELIAEYKRLHSRGVIWPEIPEGIKQVGILEMEIYICGTILVMIMEVAEGFDWESSMAKLSQLPRQAEWEELVGQYQKAIAGQTSSEKWQPMERMFHL